jgi:hypothetical protein
MTNRETLKSTELIHGEHTFHCSKISHYKKQKKRIQTNSSPETNISKQYKSKDEVPETTWNWI